MRNTFAKHQAKLSKPDAKDLNERNAQSGLGSVIYVFDRDPPTENLSTPVTWATISSGIPRLKSFDGTRMVSANGGSRSWGNEDVAITLDDAYQHFFSTTLTANRTLTLPPIVEHDRRFRITLDATSPGAFTLAVGTLKTIPASTRAFVDVVGVDGSWRLSAYGVL